MIRAAMMLAALATPALAQNHPATARSGNDTLEIVEHGTSEAVVIYRNHASKASSNGVTTLAVGMIVVDVRILVNEGADGTSETAQVMPRGGYIAIPDTLDVADGDEARFRVMLPMY